MGKRMSLFWVVLVVASGFATACLSGCSTIPAVGGLIGGIGDDMSMFGQSWVDHTRRPTDPRHQGPSRSEGLFGK